MANEIQVNVALMVNKSRLQYTQTPGSLLFDMAGTKSVGGAVAVSTTAAGTALALGDLSASTVGYAYFRNTSSTAAEHIAIGVQVSGTFYPLVGLRAGEVAVFRLNTDLATAQTVYVKSASGTPVLQYWIAEK